MEASRLVQGVGCGLPCDTQLICSWKHVRKTATPDLGGCTGASSWRSPAGQSRWVGQSLEPWQAPSSRAGSSTSVLGAAQKQEAVSLPMALCPCLQERRGRGAGLGQYSEDLRSHGGKESSFCCVLSPVGPASGPEPMQRAWLDAYGLLEALTPPWAPDPGGLQSSPS